MAQKTLIRRSPTPPHAAGILAMVENHSHDGDLSEASMSEDSPVQPIPEKQILSPDAKSIITSLAAVCRRITSLDPLEKIHSHLHNIVHRVPFRPMTEGTDCALAYACMTTEYSGIQVEFDNIMSTIQFMLQVSR